MEKSIGQMMDQRVQSPDGIIQGMGHPGKRMPVGGVEIKKSPFEKSGIKGTDMRILKNIQGVIPVHKPLSKRFQIY